jgi:hypothetical protein
MGPAIIYMPYLPLFVQKTLGSGSDRTMVCVKFGSEILHIDLDSQIIKFKSNRTYGNPWKRK